MELDHLMRPDCFTDLASESGLAGARRTFEDHEPPLEQDVRHVGRVRRREDVCVDVLKPALPRGVRGSLVPASVFVEEKIEEVAHDVLSVCVARSHGGRRVEHAGVRPSARRRSRATATKPSLELRSRCQADPV